MGFSTDFHRPYSIFATENICQFIKFCLTNSQVETAVCNFTIEKHVTITIKYFNSFVKNLMRPVKIKEIDEFYMETVLIFKRFMIKVKLSKVNDFRLEAIFINALNGTVKTASYSKMLDKKK